VLVFRYRYFHSCRCNRSSVFVCSFGFFSPGCRYTRSSTFEPFRLLSFVWLTYSLFRLASSLPDVVTPVRVPLSLFVFVCLFGSSPGCRYNHSSNLIALVVFVRSFRNCTFWFSRCRIGNKPYWARLAIRPVSFSCRFLCFYHFRSPSPQALVPQGF